MYYKSDWEEAKKRLEAFWEGEIIDRACVAVFAPRKSSKMPPFPKLTNGPWLGGLDKIDENDYESIKRWWVDPEENYNRMITWFENTYFGGEAIPATYINWGAMAEASFYGSEPKFNQKSVWYPAVIEDWDEWKWDFDQKTNIYWKQIVEIIKSFIENNNEKYFIGMPELGNAGDLLSLMRGSEKLAIDLMERPDKIKEAVNILAETWVVLHEKIFQMTVEINDNGAIIPWMNLWAPGRIDQLACDYSSLISPVMLEEFFVPDFKKMGDWADYPTYHLDGQTAIRNHVDVLCDIEQIKAIQFTPGEGSLPTYTAEYIPKYRQIQESGKNLILLADKEEIEDLLRELSPKGLFIHTYADSEEEADEIIKKVEKWSKK